MVLDPLRVIFNIINAIWMLQVTNSCWLGSL